MVIWRNDMNNKATYNFPKIINKIRKLPYEKQKRSSHITDFYILRVFLSILEFTERTVKAEEAKSRIFIFTELDFFHREHKDEAGNITKGIKTLWQLDKFVMHFNEQLLIFDKQILDLQSEIYKQIPNISLKKKTMAEDLKSLSRYNLLRGGNGLSNYLEGWIRIEMEFFEKCGFEQFDKQLPRFAEFLKHPDPEIFADKIKSEFTSVVKSGRNSAALYIALEKSGFMKYVESNTVIFNAMSDFFGNIGNMKGFNNYLNPTHQNNANLKARGIIEEFIDRLTKLNSQQ